MLTRGAKRRRVENTEYTASERTDRNDTSPLREATTSVANVVATQALKRLTYDAYTVALICPLDVEMCAAMYILDEEHQSLPSKQPDYNRYVLGRLSGHNVAIAFLPEGSQGVGAAAVVATNMAHTFPSISLRMLVGIGGGVPIRQDIRLGDVVVSVPTGVASGVVEYDLGKETPTGFERKGYLCPPPVQWLATVPLIKARHRTAKNQISATITDMIQNYPQLRHYQRPDTETDVLFKSDYEHKHGLNTCVDCDRTKAIPRVQREDEQPHVFYGLIASGNSVIKKGTTRDKLSMDCGGAICFEMEAAGLMNDFRCIVIRGISDYADSHKHDKWQAYAAAVAVAFAKEVLSYMSETSEWAVTVHQAFKPVFMVPFDRDESFVGRADALENLLQTIGKSKSRAVLAGVGGVGKSQIATEFCHQYHCMHPETHILWVHASSQTRIEQSFFEIARRLKIPLCKDEATDTLSTVSKWLSDDGHSPWLMILDNADSENLICGEKHRSKKSSTPTTSKSALMHFLPRSSKGAILMTTRNKRVGQNFLELGQPLLHILPLTLSDGVEMLRRKLDQDVEWNQTHAMELVELLAFLPLTITQAASYINQEGVTIDHYLGILHDRSAAKRLLKEHYPNSRRDSETPNAIFLTWELSFDEISRRDPRAGEMLSHMAFLDRKSIPASLITLENEDTVTFDTAVGTLKAYSFVNEERGKRIYAIHLLVQECAQAWLEVQEKTIEWQERALSAVSKACPQKVDFELWESWEVIKPHAELVIEYNAKSKPWLLQRSSLLTNLAKYDRKRGQLDFAENKAEEALEVLRSFQSKEQLNTSEAMEVLVLSSRSRRDFHRAEKLGWRLLEAREELIGEDHPQTLTAMNHLVLVLASLGNVNESETLSRKIVARVKNNMGEDHPDTLSAINDLGGILNKNGKSLETIEISRRMLEVGGSTLGKEHPECLRALDNLGNALLCQQNYKEAEVVLRESLESYGKVLGKRHPSSLGVENSLGVVLHCLGKHQEARETLVENFEMRKTILGEDHPMTKRALRNMNPNRSK